MGQDEHAATWSAVDKLDEIRKVLGIGVQDDVVRAVGDIYARVMYQSSVSHDSKHKTIKDEYAKLKAVAEGQDALIAELRLTLADAINDKRQERKRLTTERDSAELAAIYFAKRLESQYHVG